MDRPPVNFFYEDIKVGAELFSTDFTLEREAMIEFAREWDPLAIHLEDSDAQTAGFERVTASGSFLLAVKNRLIYDLGVEMATIASFGFDEVRFKAPALAGNAVKLRLEWLEKRASKSRRDRGIARHRCELIRDDGTVLLSVLDTILIRCRSSDTQGET